MARRGRGRRLAALSRWMLATAVLKGMRVITSISELIQARKEKARPTSRSNAPVHP